MATDDLPAPSADSVTAAAVPEVERSFYVDEFAGATIVVSLGAPDADACASLGRVARSLAEGRTRLVVVVSGPTGPVEVALGGTPVVLDAPGAAPSAAWQAELWLAITDRRLVVVRSAPGDEPVLAAELSVALRATKLVVTDPAGGWGRPVRSFADVLTHETAFRDQLADRQAGAVVVAVSRALAGGTVNVNLCRARDLELELFTFDGVGTLFTSGAYLDLGPLRVDELPAVERLVALGTADGVLRPRSRSEVARLAVTGLGARVVGSGHLAGLVSLEVDRYEGSGVGEVACLYTVSRFSGSGAGAHLVEGLAERAAAAGLEAIFAVTVSEAAATFFLRRGFHEVGHDGVPPAKWEDYDDERRSTARVFRRATSAALDQGSFGF